jgi:hypothetical protein
MGYLMLITLAVSTWLTANDGYLPPIYGHGLAEMVQKDAE